MKLQIDFGFHVAAQSGAELQVRRALYRNVQVQPAEKSTLVGGVAELAKRGQQRPRLGVAVEHHARNGQRSGPECCWWLVPLRRKDELAVTLMLPA